MAEIERHHRKNWLPFFVMILSCAAGCTGSISYTDETKSVLQDLDKVIGERAGIDRDKAIRIGEIKASLDGNPSPAERYEIYDRLYDEYYQYDIDSAITYARKKLSIALKTGGRNHDGLTSWTVGDAELDIADRYVLSGMNIEALDIIRKIDADSLPYDLRPRWYHICNSLYGNLYSSSDDPILRAGYLRERRRYRESLLELLGDEDISKVYVWSECEIDKGNSAGIIDSLLVLHSSQALSVHEKAVINFIAGTACRNCRRNDEALALFAESAINDLTVPVKEYKSLYSLAELLYEAGDIRRAYRYITISINDALAANAKINVQAINAMLPVISASYDALTRRRQLQLYVILTVLSLTAAGLAISIRYVLRSRKKLASANSRLQEYVEQLQESNGIKESYLGQYLDMCSEYIRGIDGYRSKLRRAAKDGGFAGVMESLKSTEYIDRELEEFYEKFDASFLDLFPDFVNRLNSLLREDRQLETGSKSGILTTEIRVAALIRLGVTDSVKIARFLRRSISTIYNYRVKMRNAAKSGREDFERQVMRIGMISKGLKP